MSATSPRIKTTVVGSYPLPDWLAAFARNQPVTRFVDALRALTLGGETASHVTAALIWVVVILAIFVPLSVRLYRRSAG